MAQGPRKIVPALAQAQIYACPSRRKANHSLAVTKCWSLIPRGLTRFWEAIIKHTVGIPGYWPGRSCAGGPGRPVVHPPSVSSGGSSFGPLPPYSHVGIDIAIGFRQEVLISGHTLRLSGPVRLNTGNPFENGVQWS